MSTSGNIIVLAHSEGAEIATRWIRTYADDPVRAAMASRITFVLSGNPLRSGSGYAIGRWECDGVVGVGTPTTHRGRSSTSPAAGTAGRTGPPTPTISGPSAEATAGKTNSHMWYSKVNLSDPRTPSAVGQHHLRSDLREQTVDPQEVPQRACRFRQRCSGQDRGRIQPSSTASASATSQSAAIPAPSRSRARSGRRRLTVWCKSTEIGGYSALA